MRTFLYCSTHKEDEAYMQKMCHEGWAATGLVEGVWTFEKCEPDQYVYRVCYLRGMSDRQIAELIAEYAGKSWIIFVVSLLLAFRISRFFLVLAALAGIYGAICTWLAVSYDKLLKALK